MYIIITCVLSLCGVEVVLGQVAGIDIVCVPQGLCTNAGGTTGGGGIDPRILTGGSSTISCAPGETPCLGLPGGGQCGRRYVTNLNPGSDLAAEGAYPWQAYIMNQTGMYTGSGVLIDATHVLTAAHKVDNNNPGDLRVYMGVFHPTELNRALVSQVTRICKAPGYLQDGTLKNDIALLTLATPVPLGYRINVGTGCLASPGSYFVGQRCMVAGWGQSRYGGNDAPTNPMKQIDVPVVPFQDCQSSMAVQGIDTSRFLDVNEFCAGGEANRDACTQDGGAPLVCDVGGTPTIAGLVIWGKGCGRQGVYGVYVDVSKYQQWVYSALSSGIC